MKTIRRTIACVMASVMLLSFAGCNKKSGVKEYTSEEMAKILVEDLGLEQDAVHLNENDGKNGYPASTELTAKYGDARILGHFIKDAKEAEEQFDRYEELYETFDSKVDFKGFKHFERNDDSGYIIIKGTDVGTGLFGDMHATGDLYGAYYYSGSMIIMIYNEPKDAGMDDVETVIKALGYQGAE